MALDTEGPEAVTDPLSRLDQPPPHPGHMPKEEAGRGETPGPQDELIIILKEEPLPHQEPGNVLGAWVKVLGGPDAGACLAV